MRAALALVCLAGVAYGEDKKPADPPKPPSAGQPKQAASADTPKPEEPDPITDVESREANLESKEKCCFRGSLTLGFGIMTGGSLGVGRGPTISVRIGEVATRDIVITFELVRGSALHKPATMDETLTDSNTGFLAGAQLYTSRFLWVRASAGLDVLTKNAQLDGTGGTSYAGVGGVVGGGLDVVRTGYLVWGFETLTLSSITSDGFKFQLAFSVGLSSR